MKVINEIIYQIKIFACELLLNLIVRIAPKKGDGLILIKSILDYCNIISKDTCPHCKFLAKTFVVKSNLTNREYWLMTEVFMYLHGGDVCEYSKEAVK